MTRTKHAVAVTCIASGIAIAACGGELEIADHESAVIGGALDYAHPEVAGLIMGSPATYYCTGVLVGSRTVLTTAHCVRDPDTGKPLDHAELHDLGEPGSVRYATDMVAHPNYTGDLDDPYIGIIRLARPVVGVRPATVARVAPSPGEQVVIVGVGTVSPDDRAVNVRRARENLIAEVNATQIVLDARNGEVTCNVDTGGPTYARRKGGLELVGIHYAESLPCGKTSVDQRVDTERTWLAVAARGDLGVYVPATQPAPESPQQPAPTAEPVWPSPSAPSASDPAIAPAQPASSAPTGQGAKAVGCAVGHGPAAPSCEGALLGSLLLLLALWRRPSRRRA